jgi:predicted transcriptional regulator of viral defense system
VGYSVPRLSPSETALLSEVDRRELTILTSADARHILGGSGPKVVSEMARKGIVDRVGRGIYVVRPLRAFGRPWGLTAIVAVEHSLAGQDHYFGGLAALTLHRLSEQSYSSVIDVYVPSRRRGRTVANARVHFHRVPPQRIEIGLATLLLEAVPVKVSDPEKTLLDALDLPGVYGGLTAAVRLVDELIDKVSFTQLVEYALELSPMSTLQRLGVLLERHGAPGWELGQLAQRAADTSNVPSMVSGLRRGPYNSRWHVVENDIITMRTA